MTTDLRDALHELADRPAVATPPSDLWRRGVRRARRRRAGAVAVAAVVAVLAGAAGLGLQHAVGRPQPATPDGTGAIPSAVGLPSRWTPGTDDAGDLGPLALLVGAERADGWWDAHGGVLGVSASGDYRFLDLPRLWVDQDPGTVSVVLSPDGQSVGYWTGHGVVVDGVAVYDTVTGEVRTLRLPSRLGLSPESLGWAEDGRALVVGYSRVTQREVDPHGAVASESSRSVGVFRWVPGRPSAERLGGSNLLSLDTVHPTSDGFTARDRGFTVWRNGQQDGPQRPVRGGADAQDLLMSPDGARLAASTADGGVRVGSLAGAGPVRLTRVATDLRGYGLLGWTDPEHLVVLAARRPGSATGDAWSVDVRSGEAKRLVRISTDGWLPGPQFATDLWARPLGPPADPAPAPDPRLVAVGGAALGALALRAGRVLWRRRRAS